MALACAVAMAAHAAEATLDPATPGNFLRERPAPPAKPFVVIAHYDLEKGLLAGYQASSGRRIVLRAIWSQKGGAIPTAMHLDPATNEVKAFFAPRADVNADSGVPIVSLRLGDADVMAWLKAMKSGVPDANAPLVQAFVDTETGGAFLEAMPALYAALEPLEGDTRLARLQAGFGVIASALQMGTGRFDGFRHAEAILGPVRSAELRGACRSRQCAYQGRWFMVQRNGLFNAMGGTSGRPP